LLQHPDIVAAGDWACQQHIRTLFQPTLAICVYRFAVDDIKQVDEVNGTVQLDIKVYLRWLDPSLIRISRQGVTYSPLMASNRWHAAWLGNQAV
jgi:hypothetical protein